MKEQKEKLYLLSLACRLSEKQAKELYGSNVLSPEQYITLTELMSKSKEELEMEKEAIVSKIAKVEQLEIEQKQIAVESREKIIGENKSKITNISQIDEEKKAKLKKFGIIGATLTVLGITFGFALSYLFANYIGFTSVDLAEYSIVYYDNYDYEGYPEIYGNWFHYSEGGYYDDAVDSLVETGIYTEEEARALMPKDASVKDVESIVTGYELSTEKGVKNGDVVEAKILYNEEEAKAKKIKVTNNLLKFTITGLREPVQIEDITADMTNQVTFDDSAAIKEAEATRFFGKTEYKVVNRGYYLLTSEYDGVQNRAEVVYLVELEEIVEKDDEPSYKIAYISEEIFKTDKEIHLENEDIDLNDISIEYGEFDEFFSDEYEYYDRVYTPIELGGN